MSTFKEVVHGSLWSMRKNACPRALPLTSWFPGVTSLKLYVMVDRGFPIQEVRKRYAEEAFLVSPQHGEKEEQEKICQL
jgi:hypothetical protein